MGQRCSGGPKRCGGGARFHPETWDNARLLAVVRTQVELAVALRRGQRLEAENWPCATMPMGSKPQIIAESAAMKGCAQARRTNWTSGRQHSDHW